VLPWGLLRAQRVCIAPPLAPPIPRRSAAVGLSALLSASARVDLPSLVVELAVVIYRHNREAGRLQRRRAVPHPAGLRLQPHPAPARCRPTGARQQVNCPWLPASAHAGTPGRALGAPAEPAAGPAPPVPPLPASGSLPARLAAPGLWSSSRIPTRLRRRSHHCRCQPAGYMKAALALLLATLALVSTTHALYLDASQLVADSIGSELFVPPSYSNNSARRPRPVR